jgi:Cytochrome P460
MKSAIVLALFAALGSVLAGQQSVSADINAPFAYPDGFRLWSHVKSGVISPAHKTFERNGGFQHVYANEPAMVGYRSREFPEGSIIVFEWLEMRDNQGAFEEGPRRQIDVMVKDAQRFATTGGWGFLRFVKDSKTEVASTPTSQDCFACHDKLKKDGLVLSRYRE